MSILYAPESLPLFSPRRLVISLRTQRALWALCFAGAAAFWYRPDADLMHLLLALYILGDLAVVTVIAVCHLVVKRFPTLELAQLVILVGGLGWLFRSDLPQDLLVAFIPAVWGFFATFYMRKRLPTGANPLAVATTSATVMFSLGALILIKAPQQTGIFSAWLGLGAALFGAAFFVSSPTDGFYEE